MAGVGRGRGIPDSIRAKALADAESRRSMRYPVLRMTG